MNAYETLYKFAKKNNKDIVVYNAMRFNSEKYWRAKIHRKSIPKTSISSTNIFEKNSLVYDTCVWNKLIKRSFWNENKFSFLKGRIYEDILLSAELYCATESVGICPEIRYYWRLREGNNKSTTQNTTNIKNLHDRLHIITKLTKLYKSKEKYRKLLIPHYKKCVEYDLPIFINNINKGDKKFQKELMKSLKPILKEIPAEIYCKDMGIFYKLKYLSILNNDLELLKKVVSYYKKYSKKKKFIKIPLILLNSIKDKIFIKILKLYLKNPLYQNQLNLFKNNNLKNNIE